MFSDGNHECEDDGKNDDACLSGREGYFWSALKVLRLRAAAVGLPALSIVPILLVSLPIAPIGDAQRH